MIERIHHVSYTVSDMNRALRFYCEGLGFEVADDRRASGSFPERLTGFQNASVRVVHLQGHGQGFELVEYFEPEGTAPAPRTCDVGSSHMCYVVSDLDGLIAKLEGLGARSLSPPLTVDGGPNAGNRCVYLLDPDGIPLELTEPGGR